MWQFLKKNEDDVAGPEPSDSAPETAPGSALTSSMATTSTNSENAVAETADSNEQQATTEPVLGAGEVRSDEILEPQAAQSTQSSSVIDNTETVQSESNTNTHTSEEIEQQMPTANLSSGSVTSVDGSDLENVSLTESSEDSDEQTSARSDNEEEEDIEAIHGDDSDHENLNSVDSLMRLIDSDDIIINFYSGGVKLKSKIIDCFIKDEHMEKLIDILVESKDTFLRDRVSKNAKHYAESYDPNDEGGEYQYTFAEFDELDYYFDNIMMQRDTDIEDQEFDEKDYSKEYISNAVKKHISAVKDKTAVNDNILTAAKDNTAKDNILAAKDDPIENNELASKLSDLKIDIENESSIRRDATSLSKEDIKTIRRCSIIAEIYSSDVDAIIDALMENPRHLFKLWTILMQPSLYKVVPLVQLFVKINETLLIKRTDQYLNLIRSNFNLTDLFIKRNIDISILNEFLIKLIITDKINKPTGIVDSLIEQNFVHLTLNLIDDKYPFYIREFAGDLIKNLISLSTYTSDSDNDDSLIIGPNNLTRELVTYKSIWKMANRIKLGGKCLFILIDLVIELIRKNNDDYDKFNILVFSKYGKFLDELRAKSQTSTNPKEEAKSPQTSKSVMADSIENRNREDFFKMLDKFPPSDRDPIYLNHVLKIFSFNLPWIYKKLSESLSSITDEEIFDETKIENYFFEEDPVKANNPFADGKTFIKQTFGYIEKLTFDKLKLVELVAELLHCSNIKLYNNVNAESLIIQRNDLIKAKIKFIKEAIEDKLILVSNDDVSPDGNIPASLAFSPLGKQRTNEESFIAENDEVDDDDYDEGDTEEADVSSLIKDESLHQPIITAEAEELSEEDRKLKKEKMLSKLALKIDSDINTKIPISESIDGKRSVSSIKAPGIEELKPALGSDGTENAKEHDEYEDGEDHSMYNSFQLFGTPDEDGDNDNLGLEFDENSPFVSETNSEKLRERCTLGDFFKIRLHDVGLLTLVFKRLFLNFPWNNFWHNVVFDLIQQLLSGKMTSNFNAFLVSSLFLDSKLIDLILVSYKRNARFLKTYNFEFAYMGHISLISEEVDKFRREFNLKLVDSRVNDIFNSSEWSDFINNDLNETKKNFTLVLGGNKPDQENIYQDPKSIILGSTEEEIENQDISRSNPRKLKALNSGFENDDEFDDDDDDDDDYDHEDDEDDDDADDDISFQNANQFKIDRVIQDDDDDDDDDQDEDDDEDDEDDDSNDSVQVIHDDDVEDDEDDDDDDDDDYNKSGGKREYIPVRFEKVAKPEKFHSFGEFKKS